MSREKCSNRKYVSREVFDQIVWERDVALAQLAEIGKGLGERMDDVVRAIYLFGSVVCYNDLKHGRL